MIFVGHSVLFRLGKMASSGEVRYMLIVAPFWGVLGAFGWEWLFQHVSEKIAFRWATVAAALPICFNGYYRVLPLTLDREWHSAERTVMWFNTSGIKNNYPKIATAQQEILYLLDIAPTDGRRLVEWRRELLDNPPPGTVAIYHPMYAVFNADSNRSVDDSELAQHGWIDVTSDQPTLGPGWKVFLSPQTVSGEGTLATRHFLESR